MLKNPEGSHEQEPEPTEKIRIGGGDFIEISKVTEGIERTVDRIREVVNVELSPKEIEKIIPDLLSLPFHIGNQKGTISFGSEGEIPDDARPTHKAEVSIAPWVIGRPKGKEEYCVSFDFEDPKIWDSGFSPHSAKNLEISQPMWSSAQKWSREEREKIRVRVGFAPEKPLKVGNKKIVMINLLAER